MAVSAEALAARTGGTQIGEGIAGRTEGTQIGEGLAGRGFQGEDLLNRAWGSQMALLQEQAGATDQLQQNRASSIDSSRLDAARRAIRTAREGLSPLDRARASIAER